MTHTIDIIKNKTNIHTLKVDGDKNELRWTALVLKKVGELGYAKPQKIVNGFQSKQMTDFNIQGADYNDESARPEFLEGKPTNRDLHIPIPSEMLDAQSARALRATSKSNSASTNWECHIEDKTHLDILKDALDTIKEKYIQDRKDGFDRQTDGEIQDAIKKYLFSTSEISSTDEFHSWRAVPPITELQNSAKYLAYYSSKRYWYYYYMPKNEKYDNIIKINGWNDSTFYTVQNFIDNPKLFSNSPFLTITFKSTTRNIDTNDVPPLINEGVQISGDSSLQQIEFKITLQIKRESFPTIQYGSNNEYTLSTYDNYLDIFSSETIVNDLKKFTQRDNMVQEIETSVPHVVKTSNGVLLSCDELIKDDTSITQNFSVLFICNVDNTDSSNMNWFKKFLLRGARHLH